MSGVVTKFAAGDPVPAWLIAVEPRTDVPAGVSAVVDPVHFSAPVTVRDDGARYVLELPPGYPINGPVVVGHLRNCHLIAERPILWPNGDYWPGTGEPPAAGWAPDPIRLARSSLGGEPGRVTVVSRTLEMTPDRPMERTYYKAAVLFGIGVLIGVCIMAGAVAAVLAALT